MSGAEVHELSCSCAKLPFVLWIETGMAIKVANSFMYLWHSIQNKRSTVIFFSCYVKIISNELSGLFQFINTQISKSWDFWCQIHILLLAFHHDIHLKNWTNQEVSLTKTIINESYLIMFVEVLLAPALWPGPRVGTDWDTSKECFWRLHS